MKIDSMRSLAMYGFWIFSCLMGVGLKAQESSEKRPNIVFIVIDDLGFADMSFLENAPNDVHTPHIDALASESLQFTQAYTTSPICSPSRMGLLTGRYQQRWGAYWYGQGGLGPEQPTLPKALKQLGYQTMKIGKTHLNRGEAENPKQHGFDAYMGFIDHTKSYVFLSKEDKKRFGPDTWKYHVGPLLKNDWELSFEEGNYTTDIFSNEAVNYIQNHQNDPFYLQLSYNAMHAPLEQNIPKYMEPFGIEDFPIWNHEEESYEDFQEKYGWGKVDKGRLRYLAALKALDEGIGSIMKALEDSGLRENTIVVLISDNGGSPGTYANNEPFTGHKYILKEGGIRTPFLMSWPKKWPQNQQREALVSTLDIFPTLLEAAGYQEVIPSDGKSLLPLMVEDQKDPHSSLIWDSGWEWAIRKGPWKLRVTIEEQEFPIFEVPLGISLHHLGFDPKEEENLAFQHPEKLDELMGIYNYWKRTVAENPEPQNDDIIEGAFVIYPKEVKQMAKTENYPEGFLSIRKGENAYLKFDLRSLRNKISSAELHLSFCQSRGLGRINVDLAQQAPWDRKVTSRSQMPQSLKTIAGLNQAYESGQTYVWKLSSDDINNLDEVTLILSSYQEAFTHLAGSDYKCLPAPRLVLYLGNQEKNRPPFARISRPMDWQVSDVDEDGREWVNLDGEASHDPDGHQLRYYWYDNGRFLGNQAKIRTALGLGTHQILLQVIDGGGAKSLDSARLIVQGSPGAMQVFPVNNWEEEAPHPGTFNIYPNPSSERLYIDLGPSEARIRSSVIRIYSQSGELLKTENMQGRKASIDLSAFAGGTYYVLLRTGQWVKRSKILIHKN